MTTETPYTTPCELLAKKTATRLVSEGLIPTIYSLETLKMLVGGVSRPEDWQLLIEKALEIEKKEGLNGTSEETH